MFEVNDVIEASTICDAKKLLANTRINVMHTFPKSPNAQPIIMKKISTKVLQNIRLWLIELLITMKVLL